VSLPEAGGHGAKESKVAHKFDPSHLNSLENPDRYRAMPPKKILRELGLGPGMTFVDVGAGSGYFSLPAAELVGPQGTVYALDLLPEMLEHLRSKRPPPWLKALPSEESRLPLADGIADIAFSCFVLHETEAPVAFLKEMGRVAKPGALVVLIDWAKVRQEEGPPYEHRIHHHRAEELALEAGLRFRRAEMITPNHYALTLFRPLAEEGG